MTIIEHSRGTELELVLEGKLDSATVKELNAVFDRTLCGIEHLIINIEKLSYISSAGLRALLIAQKTVGKKGKMNIHGANETVMEIFRTTGFLKIMSID